MAVLVEDRTYDKAAGDAIETFIRREDAERFVEEGSRRRSRARELPAD